MCRCVDLIIDSNCKIDVEGKCVKKSNEVDTNICRFLGGDAKCLYYEVDPKCKFTFSETYNKVCSDGNGLSEGLICDFHNEAETKCKLRNKNKCLDNRSKDSSETFNLSGGKKCFWINDKCKEYKIDSYCTIANDGKCARASGVEDSSFNNGECLFDINEESCTKKEKNKRIIMMTVKII